MTKNKYYKPSSNQGRYSDRTEGSGRGGRGRGRGGRGGREGGMNDDVGGDDPFRRRGGFRGGGPSGSNFRASPPPFVFDRGYARGRGRSRGTRGRGFGGADFGGFTGNFRGGRPMYHPMDEIDFEVQQWDEPPQGGRNTPGGRGRGSPSISNGNGNNTPRGRGGRGGRGGHAPKLPSTSPLSSLWNEERPLLRPIKFVRSVESATLFQEAEDLLEATAQNPDQTAQSHVPTADKVSRVFSTTHPHLFDNSLFEIEEGIEEVNFEDLAVVHERVLDFLPATSTASAIQGEVSTAIIQELTPGPEETPDLTLLITEATIQTEATTTGVEPPDRLVIEATTEATQLTEFVQDESMVLETTTVEPEPVTTAPEPSPLFVIDTDPSTSQKQIPIPTYDVHPRTVSLGESVKVEVEVETDSEDDVIVYNAPNPRISTPRVGITTLANTSPPDHTPPSTTRQINPLRRGKFVHVVGKNAKRGSSGVVGVKRKRLADNGNFATFGAAIAEASLRLQDDREEKDPKEHLRRQGDSDLDWGDETDEGKDAPAIATAEGMDLDPDLVGSEATKAAMERFVEGINGNHVTTDDLEDPNVEEYSSSDDEMDDEDEDGSDSEDVESDEERMLIEESLGSQDDTDFSDEDEDEPDPRAGFQARLDRLRKKQKKMIETGDDGAEEEVDSNFEWSEREDTDDFFEGTLDKYEQNRAAHNEVFRAIQDELFHELQPKASSSKRKDIPPELQGQWETDRLKKAKRKNERELARLEAALDPLVTRKGGKKSRKAMITAARLDPSIQIPPRTLDMDSVERQIRQFHADKDRNYMALPACDKSSRMKIHHLAALFWLKTKSKTGVLGRYTTLSKMGYSGKKINEREVARLKEEFKYSAEYDVSEDDWEDMGKGKGRDRGKGKGKGKGKEKGKGKLKKEKAHPGRLGTKEGDVVGHAAPKIDETNVGFAMLASMGWSDGAVIGSSGGLDAPITAVIKKTKLGLGATKF